MEENKKPLIKNWNNGISVAVWDRQNDAGKKYYTVSIQRKYNKGEDTITESMHIFPEDLLMLCELCRQTYTDLWAYRYKKDPATKEETKPEDDIPW